MQRLGCALGAVLVDKTESDAGKEDDPDDHGVTALPERERDGRGERQKDEHGAAELATKDPQRADVVRAYGIGSDRLQTS